ncbi:YceI family protein [Niveibacterium umoris]|uniref:Polyisoprenoid-binding protein YceI n=1 Tax=Niveibacterium umoris TaxID=1193620 RepID=A0A840BS10_9RHOO|nr:YceI family protein [Niveibacterium umoris]MBB4013177.1 polyisoprenoid-binding protein YceI [Niveibacterium umoris]
MKKLLIAAAIATLSGAVVAADTYNFDATHTWPSFEINHFGLSTQRGRFDKTTGKAVIDFAAKKGSVEAVIETGSINMGFEKWNEHLKSEDFFNAAKFPTMTFKADALTFDGDKVVAADGTLTLLGVTKPVKLTVSNFKCLPHPMLKVQACAADISTTIKRSDWGMTKYVPYVSDEVTIKIPVESLKQQ